METSPATRTIGCVEAAARTHHATSRYACLDSWRGLAALAVVLYHAGESWYSQLGAASGHGAAASLFFIDLIRRGAVRVPMFFVISGYCVSAAAAHAIEREAHPASSFTWRRLRRLVPMYWVALALMVGATLAAERAGAGGLFDGPLWGPAPRVAELEAHDWADNAALCHPWISRAGWLFGGEGGRESPSLLLPQVWTLRYEMQFYAVVALVLAVMPRRFHLGMVLVTAATLGLGLLRLTRWSWLISDTFADGRWLCYAVGCWLHARLGRRDARARLVTIGPLVLAGALVFGTRLSDHVVYYEVGVSAWFGAVLCLLHRWDALLADTRVARVLRWFGVISYSLFLLHWPVVRATANLWPARLAGSPALAILTATGLSIGIAWAANRAIERRWMATGNPARESAARRPAPRRLRGGRVAGLPT